MFNEKSANYYQFASDMFVIFYKCKSSSLLLSICLRVNEMVNKNVLTCRSRVSTFETPKESARHTSPATKARKKSKHLVFLNIQNIAVITLKFEKATF